MRQAYAIARPVVRLVTAIAIVVALTAQFQLAITRGNFDKLNFFSYFTVESNVAAAFVLIALEFHSDSALERFARAIRPAVTLYMTMTGIIYAVLLAPATADVGLTAQWVDVIVHEIAPLVVFLDWILAPPERRLGVRDIVPWLIFPVVYVRRHCKTEEHALEPEPLHDYESAPYRRALGSILDRLTAGASAA